MFGLEGEARRLWRALAATYAATCAALWTLPVFGILHAEASAVVAGVGCLAAAVTSSRARPTSRTARVQLGALAVPLAMLTASMAWRPNCGYGLGLVLFVVLVPPSVLFGMGVGAAASRARRPRTAATLAVIAIALAGVVLDLPVPPPALHLQPRFRGVLGPIYDEELAVRPGLFAAKAQTLLWAAALLSAAAWPRGGARPARAGGAALVALAASYLFAQPLGIVQTQAGLEDVLSQRVDLGRVVVHLAPETPPAERARLADEVLYRFETLAAALEVAPRDVVDVYLYPDADTKARLIGSRTTSVVPVWLQTPQVHMLADQVGRSLGHEMVHVLAREFGMPIVGASPAIGLVEGLAVALEPPDGWPSPTALVVAGQAAGTDAVRDPAAAVRATMSPAGFWTSRAGVAYTANGAFVRWLLDTHGAGPVKDAYRTGRFEPAFGADLGALAAAWARDLAALEVDTEAVAVAEWLFSRPSLFEVRCPHWVPPAVRLARAGAEAREAGDLEAAAGLYRRALEADPLRLAALEGDLGARLALGGDVRAADLEAARALADTLATSATLVHLADVQKLLGRPSSRATHQRALDSLAAVDAVGRFVVGRRRALEAGPLRDLIAASPLEVPASLVRADPVLAALRYAALDEPDRAWALARTWCLDLEAGSEAAHVARFLQARIAYRAGALDAAGRLYAGLEDAFRASGRPASRRSSPTT